MKKNFVGVVAIVLIAVVCVATFVGCDGASKNVTSLQCFNFFGDQYVFINLSKRLPKISQINKNEISIKYEKSLSELYDLMQMEEGCKKTLCDDYILIESTIDGRVYTWGVFSTSVFGEDYLGNYNYVLTNMTVKVVDEGYSLLYFPIYTMKEPLLSWKNGQRYACDLTVEQLEVFYTQQGCTTEIVDNVLTVATPIRTHGYSSGNEMWDVTFHGDGTISVGNFRSYWATDD